MFIYSITFYGNKNKIENIQKHINEFNKIKISKKFILCVMINDINNKQIYYDKYHDYLKNILNLNNFDIIINFNWGGTIAGLWYIYLYCSKLNDLNNIYIAHFEEDFTPINDEWHEFSKELLDKNDIYSFIGETNTENPYNNKLGVIKYATNTKGQTYWNNIFSTLKPNNDYICGCKGMYDIKCRGKCKGIINHLKVWSDGGFYFTTYNKLKVIDDRIGIFHKGDINKNWDHVIDGVELGEVGFPTLLFYHGLQFGTLSRKYFFVHK